LQSLVSVPQSEQVRTHAAFAELGTNLLKPVFDRLEGQVSYDTLKILLLLYLLDHP